MGWWTKKYSISGGNSRHDLGEKTEQSAILQSKICKQTVISSSTSCFLLTKFVQSEEHGYFEYFGYPGSPGCFVFFGFPGYPEYPEQSVIYRMLSDRCLTSTSPTIQYPGRKHISIRESMAHRSRYHKNLGREENQGVVEEMIIYLYTLMYCVQTLLFCSE